MKRAKGSKVKAAQSDHLLIIKDETAAVNSDSRNEPVPVEFSLGMKRWLLKQSKKKKTMRLFQRRMSTFNELSNNRLHLNESRKGSDESVMRPVPLQQRECFSKFASIRKKTENQPPMWPVCQRSRSQVDPSIPLPKLRQSSRSQCKCTDDFTHFASPNGSEARCS